MADNSELMTGLLPCPFCGQPPIIVDGTRYAGEKFIQCDRVTCPVIVQVYGATEAEAIERWNHRPPVTAEAGEVSEAVTDQDVYDALHARAPGGAEVWLWYPTPVAYARAALSRLTPPKQDDATAIFDAEDIKDLERMVPDLNAVLTQNPLHKVYFRAGLLACREYMARFVEYGGNPAVAQSIRANWWPSLGEDPGVPRQLAFDEVVEEVEAPDGKKAYPSKPMDPSVEALPIALAFIGHKPADDPQQIGAEPEAASTRPSPEGYEWTRDRDDLGRKVRAAWVAWAETQPNPKASWLMPYDDLSEADKEADRQIGEALTVELAELAEGLGKWGDEQSARADAAEAALLAARRVQPKQDAFQARVAPWMQTCFGAEVSADKLERGDRLLEEVLELLQSGDYPKERIAALADYTYARPKGEPHQEAGGVMVTLAAYCLAHDLDMHRAGEDELARVWTKVDKIRAKQAAKPIGSALPVAAPKQDAPSPTYRHKKRGTEYVLIGIGKMQAEKWGELSVASENSRNVTSVDMREVAIYRAVDDGSLWVRPRDEFEDGRFEEIKK